LSSKEKKAKKELVTMVVNDLKSSLGKGGKKISKEKDEGDDDDLYDLVRGKRSTMMIQRLDGEGNEFVSQESYHDDLVGRIRRFGILP
jgi:hypothetical protein